MTLGSNGVHCHFSLLKKLQQIAFVRIVQMVF
jgi:hypothetical protein